MERLGAIGGPQAVAALVRVLSSGTDPELRQRAALALGATKSPEAVGPLAEALRTDRAAAAGAATALGAIGTAESAVALGEAYGRVATSSPFDRTLAERLVAALAQIGDPAAADPLASVLESEPLLNQNDADELTTYKAIRLNAARALAERGDERAREPLTQLLQDADLRFEAQAALDVLDEKARSL